MADSLVKRLLTRAAGGRPMTRLEYIFIDILSGDPVYYYEDKFGRVWMAKNAWSLFRVEAPYGRLQ